MREFVRDDALRNEKQLESRGLARSLNFSERKIRTKSLS